MTKKNRLCVAMSLAAATFFQPAMPLSKALARNPQAYYVESKRRLTRLPRVVRLSSDELRKRAIECSVPLFPATGTHVRAKGTVMVEILIDTDGVVRSAKVVSGHPLLRASAVQAARKWGFRPVKSKRRLVRAIGLLPIIFSWDSDEMRKQCEGLKIVE